MPCSPDKLAVLNGWTFRERNKVGIQKIAAGRALRAGLLASCACALSFAGAAFAQEGPQQAQGRNANSQLPEAETGLADIVVTAQRRTENSKDVPVSVALVGAEALQSVAATGLFDVAKLVSAVRFDTRVGNNTPSIRGLSTTVTGPGLGTNVGVYLDGFFSPSLQAVEMQLNNVENIQVLKGPQGTLFGRNVESGAILVNTSRPSEVTRAVLELAYGNYNTKRGQFYGTTGIVKGVAADIAVAYLTTDGYVKNIVTGQNDFAKGKQLSVRAGLNFELSDKFSVLARYSYSNNTDPTSFILEPAVINGQVPCDSCALPGAIFTTEPNRVTRSVPVSNLRLSDAFQLTAQYDFGSALLTSYTQYRKDSQAGYGVGGSFTSLPPVFFTRNYLGLLPNDKTFTQELLLTSKPGSRLQYTAGLFYLWQKSYFGVDVTFTPGATPKDYVLGFESGVSNRSLAAYADLTYKVGERLFLTGGVRYTHDTVFDGFRNQGASRIIFPSLSGGKVTWRGVALYAVTDTTNVYGSISTGYKNALYNVVSPIINPVAAETLTDFEIGVKHASQNFSVNLAGYYYKYSNAQVVSSSFFNGLPATFVRNAGQSKLYGVEGDVRYRFSHNFDIHASANLNHTEYGTFLGAPAFSNVGPPFLEGAQDATGTPLIRSPKFTANVGATLRQPFANGELALTGNYSYTSEFFWYPGRQVPEGAYGLVDLQLAWTDSTNLWRAALTAKNVTNTHYRTQLFNSGGGGYGAGWNAPTQVEFSVSRKFGG